MKKEFIKKWLKEHEYCVLATSFQDKPWAATVNYTIDDDLNIYISSNPESLKFQNLIKNPIVSLVVDDQTREGTLQIQGRAKPLKPKTPNEPNLFIKPEFLIFKKKHESGKLELLELRLND